MQRGKDFIISEGSIIVMSVGSISASITNIYITRLPKRVMVRRRRKARRKPARTFGINVIETGAALALLEQTGAGSAMQSFLAGNLNAGLSTLSKNAKSNKQAITKTLVGAFLAKAAVRSFSRGSPVLASLGPIKVRA